MSSLWVTHSVSLPEVPRGLGLERPQSRNVPSNLRKAELEQLADAAHQSWSSWSRPSDHYRRAGLAQQD